MRNYSRISSGKKGGLKDERRGAAVAACIHKSPEKIYYNKMRCCTKVHTHFYIHTQNMRFLPISILPFLPAACYIRSAFAKKKEKRSVHHTYIYIS